MTMMLAELHLENLGVIEGLDVVFDRGMTAVTGETGAGKTLIVEAIELLVGGRADSSMVRSGADEARVDGRFVSVDGEEVVVSRVISVNGRSRAYLNGRPSTVSAVAEVCRGLVDLHGQHAHQSLLSATTQRAAIDRFGGIDLEPLRDARRRLTEVEAAMFALGGDERERARDIDLLRYQVDELDQAAIADADEDVRLAEVEDGLADAVAHRDSGGVALGLLADEGAIRDRLAEAVGLLTDRGPFRESAERLAGLLAEIDDVTMLLRDSVERVEENPQQLDAVRARRQRLAELRRKYGSDLAEVIGYGDEARQRLRELESFDERAAELLVQRDALQREVESAALEVGRQRRSIAPSLAQQVQVRLRELALPAARLEFHTGPELDDPAADDIEVYFSANPDSPPQPLNKVASGGELARTMLALRLVLMATGDTASASASASDIGPSASDGPGTLVFDEVDAGLGGAAAVAVGQALGRLARVHQVFVVTHLAQVASEADRQLVVAKRVEGEQTRVETAVVDGDGRIDELARMLAGSVTETARRHAAELLGRSTPEPVRGDSM
jgi:DNA repair protein RecN (Recombination protein N)